MTRFPMVSPKNTHEKKYNFLQRKNIFLAAVAADRVLGEDSVLRTHMGKKEQK